MRKKWMFVAIISLLLASCASMKRSDVVDVLIDNSYSRNAAGFYEKFEDSSYIRIGYKNAIIGYLESLENYITPGPVVLVDIGNNVSFNYHFNEDAMLFNKVCVLDQKPLYSEVMYSFKDESFIVGADDCKFEVENQEPLIKEFHSKKEMILTELERMNLTKKKLALLKE